MHAGGLCCQWRQDGCWDRGGLHPTHYRRYATTKAGLQGSAANRPTGRGGVQRAEPKLRKGRQGEDAAVGHVEVLGDDQRLNAHSLLAKTRWTGADLYQLVADELSSYRRTEEMQAEIAGGTLDAITGSSAGHGNRSP
jgi:hypothetical protein